MSGLIDVSDGPYDNPCMYVVVADEYMGLPKGETIIRDPEHPMVIKGLHDGALKSVNTDDDSAG